MKRILAIVLTLCMVLTLLPASVLAADSEEEIVAEAIEETVPETEEAAEEAAEEPVIETAAQEKAETAEEKENPAENETGIVSVSVEAEEAGTLDDDGGNINIDPMDTDLGPVAGYIYRLPDNSYGYEFEEGASPVAFYVRGAGEYTLNQDLGTVPLWVYGSSVDINGHSHGIIQPADTGTVIDGNARYASTWLGTIGADAASVVGCFEDDMSLFFSVCLLVGGNYTLNPIGGDSEPDQVFKQIVFMYNTNPVTLTIGAGAVCHATGSIYGNSDSQIVVAGELHIGMYFEDVDFGENPGNNIVGSGNGKLFFYACDERDDIHLSAGMIPLKDSYNNDITTIYSQYSPSFCWSSVNSFWRIVDNGDIYAGIDIEWDINSNIANAYVMVGGMESGQSVPLENNGTFSWPCYPAEISLLLYPAAGSNFRYMQQDIVYGSSREDRTLFWADDTDYWTVHQDGCISVDIVDLDFYFDVIEEGLDFNRFFIHEYLFFGDYIFFGYDVCRNGQSRNWVICDPDPMGYYTYDSWTCYNFEAGQSYSFKIENADENYDYDNAIVEIIEFQNDEYVRDVTPTKSTDGTTYTFTPLAGHDYGVYVYWSQADYNYDNLQPGDGEFIIEFDQMDEYLDWGSFKYFFPGPGGQEYDFYAAVAQATGATDPAEYFTAYTDYFIDHVVFRDNGNSMKVVLPESVAGMPFHVGCIPDGNSLFHSLYDTATDYSVWWTEAGDMVIHGECQAGPCDYITVRAAEMENGRQTVTINYAYPHVEFPYNGDLIDEAGYIDDNNVYRPLNPGSDGIYFDEQDVDCTFYFIPRNAGDIRGLEVTDSEGNRRLIAAEDLTQLDGDYETVFTYTVTNTDRITELNIVYNGDIIAGEYWVDYSGFSIDGEEQRSVQANGADVVPCETGTFEAASDNSYVFTINSTSPYDTSPFYGVRVYVNGTDECWCINDGAPENFTVNLENGTISFDKSRVNTGIYLFIYWSAKEYYFYTMDSDNGNFVLQFHHADPFSSGLDIEMIIPDDEIECASYYDYTRVKLPADSESLTFTFDWLPGGMELSGLYIERWVRDDSYDEGGYSVRDYLPDSCLSSAVNETTGETEYTLSFGNGFNPQAYWIYCIEMEFTRQPGMNIVFRQDEPRYAEYFLLDSNQSEVPDGTVGYSSELGDWLPGYDITFGYITYFIPARGNVEIDFYAPAGAQNAIVPVDVYIWGAPSVIPNTQLISEYTEEYPNGNLIGVRAFIDLDEFNHAITVESTNYDMMAPDEFSVVSISDFNDITGTVYAERLDDGEYEQIIYGYAYEKSIFWDSDTTVYRLKLVPDGSTVPVVSIAWENYSFAIADVTPAKNANDEVIYDEHGNPAYYIAEFELPEVQTGPGISEYVNDGFTARVFWDEDYYDYADRFYADEDWFTLDCFWSSVFPSNGVGFDGTTRGTIAYYSGDYQNTARIIARRDATQYYFPVNSLIPVTGVEILLDGNKLTLGTDYTLDTAGNTIVINSSAFNGCSDYSYCINFNFAMPKRTVQVTSGSAAGGTATVSCVTGGGEYEMGSEVTVTANAVAGYSFFSWLESTDGGTTFYQIDNATDLSYTFTVSEDIILKAAFTPVSSVELRVDGDKYTVNGVTQRGRYNNRIAADTAITLTYTGNNIFLYWVNEVGNIVSTSPEYTFTIVSTVTLEAVYVSSDVEWYEAYVLFSSGSNQILASRYYTSGEDIVFPVSPARIGKVFDRWSMTQAEIHDAMQYSSYIIVEPVFVSSGETYVVTVNYGFSDNAITMPATNIGPIDAGAAFSVTAPSIDGYVFNYWKQGDTIVSYSVTYSSYASLDVELTAYYGKAAVERQATVAVTQFDKDMNGTYPRLKITMTYSVPSGCTITGAGYVRSDNASSGTEELLVLGNVDGSTIKNSAAKTFNGTYILNLNRMSTDQMVYFRAYLTYQDASGTNHAIYTPGVYSTCWDEIN